MELFLWIVGAGAALGAWLAIVSLFVGSWDWVVYRRRQRRMDRWLRDEGFTELVSRHPMRAFGRSRELRPDRPSSDLSEV